MKFIENITISEALDCAIKQQKENSIGVLAEKTLHSTLKLYFCNDISCHEKKYRGYIADILIENGEKISVIEVQTRQTYKLAKKLSAYGSDTDVMVVLPIFAKKNVIWIDNDNGIMSAPHKTTRPKNVFHGIKELYSLRDYVGNTNITFSIVLMEVDEYRYLNGWSKDKKRGSVRCNTVPKSIIDIISLNKPDDYINILPYEINGEFTVSDFAKKAKISITDARYVILVLAKLNIVEECGRISRKKLWRTVYK